MSTTSGLKKGDYPRRCDICSHMWMFSRMQYIGQKRWACPDDAKGLTAEQISRHNAHVRAMRVRPHAHPKPDGVVDIYQLAEAEIFNFVTQVAPWNTRADKDNNAAKSVQAAAHAAVYLADLITENTRPAIWIRQAKESMSTCLTYLLTQQYGSPTGIANSDTTNALHGGILDGSTLNSHATIMAGAAFARSYVITGSGAHLDAAKRCATYVRHMQCAWRSTGTDITRYGGGTYKIEGVAAGTDTAGLMLPQYKVSNSGLACWFLTILGTILGTSTQYGEASSTKYSGDTRATIAEMITAAASFLETGVRDQDQTGTVVPGLSATTPRMTYTANTAASTTNATWGTDVALLTDEWAQALFGLNYAGLNTTQVNACHDFLLGMSANPANAETSQMLSVQRSGVKGTYAPKIAPAVSVNVLTGAGALLVPAIETTGTYYSWSAAAWLGPIESVRHPADFKASKNALNVPRRIDTTSVGAKYMGPLSRSGLNFQVANLEQIVAAPP